MQVQYTNNREYNEAYLISDCEKKLLVSALKAFKKTEFKKIDKQIKAIEDDEENEGQVTFKEEIKELRYKKKEIDEIISILS